MTNLLSILLFSLLGLINGGEDAKIAFVGDAMQHRPQSLAAQQPDGTFDYSSCFTLLEPEITKADYAVVNLEAPLGGKPYSGYPAFSAPDEFALQLKTSGFDLFLTANNHCMDRSHKGLIRTFETLDKLEVAHIGTYPSAKVRKDRLPYIANINGNKIAFLSYTYGTNGIPITGNVIVDLIKRNLIKTDIDLARLSGAEMICVTLHWGIEYAALPSKEQKELADYLVDLGVDMIIGSHPHVIQPMELRFSEKYLKNTLIVYSLGNFISNQNDLPTRGGAMVNATICRHGSRAVLTGATYNLFFCQKPKNKGENYRLIPSSMPDSVRSDSQNTFNAFMIQARNLLNKHNINVPEQDY